MCISGDLAMVADQDTAFRRQCGDAGFTLLELLVTISIIGFLLVILLPTMTTIRQAAWSSTCRANLRQFGLANQAYALDWRFLVPAFMYDAAGGPGFSNSWISNKVFLEILSADGRNDHTYRITAKQLCPTSINRNPSTLLGGSYGINLWAPGYNRPAGPNVVKAALPGQARGDVIMFIDAQDWLVNPNQAGLWEVTWAEGYLGLGTTAYRHSLRANAVCYDGSVVTLRMTDLHPANVSRYWK
jgi:prepilin-type N-terminal cleavage/methylation domain-containing protein